MSHPKHTLQQFMSAFIALTMVCVAVLAGPPPAQAKENTTTVFETTFEAAPIGPITTPLAVEIGTVKADKGTVAITQLGSSRALSVDGTAGDATALLQFSNYPGALPAKEKGAFRLRIEAELTMPVSSSTPEPYPPPGSTTTGASFGLFAAPAFFEFFSFGANGALLRDGRPTGLTAAAGSTVTLDARLKIGPGRQVVTMVLTANGVKQNFNLTLDNAFSRETVNQLRVQAPAGSGLAALDNVRVRVMPDDRDPEPPAVINITNQTVEQTIEVINNITIVNLNFTFINTGGAANGAFLVLNLADLADFDLDDISFLIGTGYVAKTEGQTLYIGLGKNNLLDGTVKLKIKFKAKKQGVDVKINVKFNLQFDDTDGFKTIAVPVVVVPVVIAPVVVAPVIVQALPLSAIDDRFEDYWASRGGLVIFGLPLTQPITQSNGLIVQYFERVRLELHPTLKGTPYYIQLGLLAVELGYTQIPTTTTTPTDTVDLVWFFKPTGYVIASPFRAFWRSNGGLAIFGQPITPVIVENGQQIQYFERARLELHPENAGTTFEVQIGLLGVEQLKKRAK